MLEHHVKEDTSCWGGYTAPLARNDLLCTWLVMQRQTYSCTGCAQCGLLTGASGTFSDGSGSSNYVNSANCEWIIAPPGNSLINILFTDLSMGEELIRVFQCTDIACSDQKQLAELSGWYFTPPSVTVTTGFMKVVFTFNASFTPYQGFTASWTSVSSLSEFICWLTVNISARLTIIFYVQLDRRYFCQGCGTACTPCIFSATNGSISDGSGTSDYGNNAICGFLIVPPTPSVIQLTFTELSTEFDYDFIYVWQCFDVNCSQYKYLTSLSGWYLTPPVVTINTGNLLIDFRSDAYVTSDGFKASWILVRQSSVRNIHNIHKLF